MATDVCEMTELPSDQCSHCTGAKLEGDRPVRIGLPMISRRRGNCGHCDDRFSANTEIALAEVDGDRVWCIASHTVGGGIDG